MKRVNVEISWVIVILLFFGSTAGAIESYIAENLKAAKEAGGAFDVKGTFSSNPVYVDFNGFPKLEKIKNDLLTLEFEIRKFQGDLAAFETVASISTNAAENCLQKTIGQAFLKLNDFANETQRLHAESANIAFLSKSDAKVSAYEAASEIKTITIRLSVLSQSEISASVDRLSTIVSIKYRSSPPADVLWKIDDVKRYTHNLIYHLRGIQKSAEDLSESSSSVGRPGFPIPIPFPPNPSHPPIYPSHPSTPTNGAIEECKGDCNYQYDADCEACSDYVTDPRALALCYSSAATRQGTCIRNCYRN